MPGERAIFKELVMDGLKAGARDYVRVGAKEGAKHGAEKIAVKAAIETEEIAAKQTVKARALPSWIKYVRDNPGNSAKLGLLGVAGLGVLSGQGAVKGVQFALGGWKASNEGVIQTGNRWVNGDERAEKHNLGAATIDSFMGDGTTDQIAESFQNAKEGVQEGFRSTRDHIASLGGQIREQFSGQDGHEYMSDQYPTGLTQDQLEEIEMRNFLHYANYPMNDDSYGQMYRKKGGFFDQASDFVSNLFGNKNATMGTTAVAAAAWLLFGRFGWLAKVGGVLGGYWGLGKLRDGLGDSYSQVRAARRGNMIVERGGIQYEVPRSPGQNFDQMYEMDRQQSQQRIHDRSNPNLTI